MNWISVEDKFPNVDDDYLVYISIDEHGCEVAHLHVINHDHGCHSWFEINGIDEDYITHWMPLPDPPYKHSNAEENATLREQNAKLLAALKEIKELTKYWNNNLPHRMELINGICDQKIAEAEGDTNANKKV